MFGVCAFVLPRRRLQLCDAEAVLSHPHVKGIEQDVLFVDHREPEDGEAAESQDATDTGSRRGWKDVHVSHSNSHEARRRSLLLQHPI